MKTTKKNRDSILYFLRSKREYINACINEIISKYSKNKNVGFINIFRPTVVETLDDIEYSLPLLLDGSHKDWKIPSISLLRAEEAFINCNVISVDASIIGEVLADRMNNSFNSIIANIIVDLDELSNESEYYKFIKKMGWNK